MCIRDSILRDGENGCPWDKVQTHASIRKNFLEETCEALEAIDADDPVTVSYTHLAATNFYIKNALRNA